MARKISAEKELYWREILNQQAGSGLSIRKFCRKEAVSEPSFYAWRKKLKTRETVGKRLGMEQPDNGRLFVPLKLVDASPKLEIIHPLGYRVQVTDDVNPVALRQVIEVLDERGAR